MQVSTVVRVLVSIEPLLPMVLRGYTVVADGLKIEFGH